MSAKTADKADTNGQPPERDWVALAAEFLTSETYFVAVVAMIGLAAFILLLKAITA